MNDRQTSSAAGRRAYQWGIVLLLLFLAPFFYAKWFAGPWADELWVIDHGNFSLLRGLETGWHAYWNWGGRYLGYSTTEICNWAINDPASYWSICALTFLLVFGGFLLISNTLFRAEKVAVKLFWSLLFLAALYASLPALSQMFYWVANLFSATWALLCWLYVIGFAAWVWRSDRPPVPAVAGLFLAAFATPGFYEHGSIVLFFTALTLLILGWQQNRHRRLYTILFLFSLAMIATSLGAPGNYVRHTQTISRGLFEKCFMTARTGIGLFSHTLLSPCLLLFPALIFGLRNIEMPIIDRLTLRQRLLLLLPTPAMLGGLLAMHAVANYDIEFATRTGGSALWIFWISLGWVVVLFRRQLASILRRWPKLFRLTPALAVAALFLSANNFRLWSNILNGSMRQYRSEIWGRVELYRNSAGKELAISPLSTQAWPAQKVCITTFEPDIDLGAHPLTAERYHLKSLRVRPNVREVREHIALHPESVLPGETVSGVNGSLKLEPQLVTRIPVGNGQTVDWLWLRISGPAAEIAKIQFFRLLTFTDRTLLSRSGARSFSAIGEFPRLSLYMAAAVYLSGGNHTGTEFKHTVVEPPEDGKDSVSLLVRMPLTKLMTEETLLLYLTLDCKTYYQIYKR